MKILCLSLLMMALVSPAMAQEQHIKKVTPVLEIGMGVSAENREGSDPGDYYGVATDVSAGLDIRVSRNWSVMPSIGYNGLREYRILGLIDAYELHNFKEGGYNASHAFISTAVCAIYHTEDGFNYGIGPFASYDLARYIYFSEEEIGGKPEIKRLNAGIRASVTKHLGRHWMIGGQLNVGLRNLLIQYPEYDITGKDHINYFCVTAGYRF